MIEPNPAQVAHRRLAQRLLKSGVQGAHAHAAGSSEFLWSERLVGVLLHVVQHRCEPAVPDRFGRCGQLVGELMPPRYAAVAS
jgi:hypothetical protein